MVKEKHYFSSDSQEAQLQNSSGSITQSAVCRHDHLFSKQTLTERTKEVLGVAVYADTSPYQSGRCRGKPPFRSPI